MPRRFLSDALARDGIEVRLNTTAVNVRLEGGEKFVDLVSDDNRNTVVVDAILAGAGRAPNVEGMDLETAGVDYDKTLGIKTDDYLQTSNPRIYAAGDVCLEHKYTHTADASARIVIRNALFLGRRRVSALTISGVPIPTRKLPTSAFMRGRHFQRDIPLEDVYRANA